LLGNRSAGEVSGHFHPKAAVRTRGRRISGRCFVTDGRRLILPAFGAYTGGLNVLDPALESLLLSAFRVFVIGR
jgi:metallophosphoesterase superfamily enzyme